MKGYLVILAVAFAAVAGELCPSGQDTDWSIEKLLPHEDCDKFYQCTYGIPVEQACPAGLYYSIEKHQCDYPSNVDCDGRQIPEDNPEQDVAKPSKADVTNGNNCPSKQLTDWSIEHLMPHEDCNKFYQCAFGQPIERVCPEGLYYSIQKQQCEFWDDVDCSGRNPGLIKPEIELLPEPRCPAAQIEDWSIHKLLPHQKCNKFYICANGFPVEINCPNGLVFDIKEDRCEWPETVDCGNRT